jgi:hypothetical protein
MALEGVGDRRNTKNHVKLQQQNIKGKLLQCFTPRLTAIITLLNHPATASSWGKIAISY